MILKDDSSEQKLRGAYYTPKKLAETIVKIISPKMNTKILEPSCGDGVFLDALQCTKFLENFDKVTAIEIDEIEATKVKRKFERYCNVEVNSEDFFYFYQKILGKKRYDLILGNPPYIRYQYLTDLQRKLQSKILTSLGMKSNKLINAWVAFMVACVQLLTSKGKIAFIIPAEILQVAYAEELRLYLAEKLSKITLITFDKLVFPSIEQEVVVFIGEKGESEAEIRIIETNDVDSLSSVDFSTIPFQKLQHVKEKWTKYFISSSEITTIQDLRKDIRFAKFSDFGAINVGITTGNNSYFSITDDVSKLFDLDDVSLPLIGRSSHSHGIFFTKQDWEKNRILGKKARLILFPDIPFDDYPESHKKYIRLGEKDGDNKGYKCSIRDRWYIVPSVWIPDAFFLRRNNHYPKFVLNRCDAVSTDTMHRIKFKAGIEPLNILLSYYNSVSFAFTEICGRSYGGGVLEILPSEVGKILLPKIPFIESSKREYLLSFVDSVVRKGENIENALDIVDQELLINILKIEPEICNKCRTIWKKLQKRRLERY